MLTRIHRRSDWIGDATKVGRIRLTRLVPSTSLGDGSLDCTSKSVRQVCVLHYTILYCTVLYSSMCMGRVQGGREYVDSRAVGNRND